MQATEVYGDLEALSSGHAEAAPFVLAVLDTNQQGTRVVSKALLLFKQGVVSQFDRPPVPELLLFLLGSYFVLDIAYPLAYNSFLRLIEKNVHNELSYNTSKTRAKQEYNNFIKNKFNLLD